MADQALVQWQWEHYPRGHQDRRNLLVHVCAVPLFWAGTLASLAAPFTDGRMAIAGLAAMALSVGAQGRGHALEVNAPIPSRGPGDIVARLFVEQWITFPRFVLGGGFRAAWRTAAGSH